VKLADLSFEMLSRAIDIYLSLAWPGREDEKRPEFDARASGSGLLENFDDESKEEGGEINHRFVKRLGNKNYPHMKLVVEECLIPDEFFLAVDTHDELELKPDYPDYDAWQALKAKNRAIKDAIEARWREADLPTYASLRGILEEAESGKKKKASKAAKILIVDDERDIADAVSALLIKEGYDVLLAHDGIEAVDTALLERPDLILMDFQMPRMDGVEAAVRIRKSKTRRECRILLATASLVDLSRVSEADGFLMKPYSKDILLSFIQALLAQHK
jgi:CheY-like chemotaxis protein